MTTSKDVAPNAGLARDPQHAEFLAYYHLDRDPFSDLNISGLFFPGAGRAEIVESLLHFVHYGQAPVFLTGNSGSGKSATLQALLARLDSDFDIVVIDAVLMMTPGQMLISIARELGLSEVQELAPDYGLVDDCILEFVTSKRELERRVLICIDNVQDLSLEVYDALLGLLSRADDSLSMLLVGEGQAQVPLTKTAAEYQLLLNLIELPSLGDADVESYIRYRMESAGFVGEPPLTDIQLQAIKRRSHGSLDQLNRVAKSMLIAGVDGVAPSNRTFPLPHLVFSVVVLLIIAVLLRGSVLGENEEAQQTDAQLPLVLEGVMSRKGSSNVRVSSVQDDTKKASAEKTIASAPVEQNTRENSIGSSEQPKNNSESNSSKIERTVSATQANSVIVNDTGNRIPASAQLASRNLDSAESQQRSAEGQYVTELGLVANDGELEPTGSVASTHSVEAENAVSDKEGSIGSSLAEKESLGDSESTLVDQSTFVDQPGAASDVAELADSHQQLMSWPEVGYALQVFGTHNPVRARQLVIEHGSKVDLVYYETRHQGQPWYVVISGPYTGREMATKGIQTLPSSLQRLRPWPRNIASIQSDITRYSDAIRVNAEQ